jgi:hypothetical protein
MKKRVTSQCPKLDILFQKVPFCTIKIFFVQKIAGYSLAGKLSADRCLHTT